MKVQVQYEIPDKHDEMMHELLNNGDIVGVAETLENYGRLYGPVFWQSKDGNGSVG